MTRNTIRRTTLRKFGTMSVLALAALSLLPQGARADNDGFNDGLRLAQYNNLRITIRGTVQSDGSGSVFTLRTDNGRTVTVYSRTEPQRLSRGDLVEATGSLDRRTNRFTADNVRVLRNNGNSNNGQRITARGTVQSDASGNVFTMRTDSGRTMRVYSRFEPKRLSRGDYVEIAGDFNSRDNIFAADTVRVLRNNGNNNGGGYGTLTRGIVTDERRGQDAFVMRASDGRTYLVNTRNVNQPNLQRGQTVEVRGRVLGGAIYASSVRVVGNGGYGNNVMTGRVSRDYAGRDFELRTDNGRSVTVRTRNEPIRLSRGDWVEVRGGMSNGVFQADTVRILRNDGNNGNANRVDFTGTVRQGGTASFTVRADNGRDYTVQNGNVAVNTSDRVRVIGSLNRGVVSAERVTVRDRFNSGNNGTQGDFVRIDAIVQQVGNGYLVVSDNSKNLTVRTNNARAFNRNDRVRVEGYQRNGQVTATSISRR